MWRFRPGRPFLLLMAVLDLIAATVLLVLGIIHAPMTLWTTDGVTALMVANLTALWRDGVS